MISTKYLDTKQCSRQMTGKLSGIMRKLVFYLILIVLTSSCKSKEVIRYVPVKEIHTEEIILRDTVIDIQLVPYSESVTIQDTASFLENPYAYSYASFCAGNLRHSLIIKNIKLPTEVVIQEKIIRDSIPYPIEIKGDTVIIYKRGIFWWAGIVFLLFLFGTVIFKLAKKFR